MTGFEAVSLDDLEKKSLLNRYDTKFVLSEVELPEILSNLTEHYKVLEIDGRRVFQYENLYFDTDELIFYTQHHNGKSNRFKVRFRNYIESGTCFFEIKQKTNKNLVLKDRIKAESFDEELTGVAFKQLLNNRVGIDSHRLRGKLRINYNRITLVSKQNAEKITFDNNLYFKNCNSDSFLKGIVIAEIKNTSYSDSSEFGNILKYRNTHPFRVSKYCTGTILTNAEVKYNRFKYKMMFLRKIQDNFESPPSQAFAETLSAGRLGEMF